MKAQDLTPGMKFTTPNGVVETVMFVMFPSYLPDRVQVSSNGSDGCSSDALYFRTDELAVVE